MEIWSSSLKVDQLLVAAIITLHLTIKEERRLEQVSIMGMSEFVLVSKSYLHPSHDSPRLSCSISNSWSRFATGWSWGV